MISLVYTPSTFWSFAFFHTSQSIILCCWHNLEVKFLNFNNENLKHLKLEKKGMAHGNKEGSSRHSPKGFASGPTKYGGPYPDQTNGGDQSGERKVG